MISVQNFDSNEILSLVGLSTDTKPDKVLNGKLISNGCSLFEMDTGTLYLFDAENLTWIEV